MRTQPALKPTRAPISETHPVLVAGRALDVLIASRASLHAKNPGPFRMAAQWAIGNSSRILRGSARVEEHEKLRTAVCLLGGWLQNEAVAQDLRDAASTLLQEIRSSKLLPAKQA